MARVHRNRSSERVRAECSTATLRGGLSEATTGPHPRPDGVLPQGMWPTDQEPAARQGSGALRALIVVMGTGQDVVVVDVLEPLAVLGVVERAGQRDEVGEVGVLAVDVDGATGGGQEDVVAVGGADLSEGVTGVIEAMMVAGQGHVVVGIVAAGLGVVVGCPASSPQMPSFPEIVD